MEKKLTKKGRRAKQTKLWWTDSLFDDNDLIQYNL